MIRHKHILAYSKNTSGARTSTTGTFASDDGDKRFHEWGQDVSSARYFIDCFSKPNDLVCDPFIGGGTTAVACELIKRRWIAFDIDPVAVCTTQQRLNGTFVAGTLPLFT